VIKRHDKFYVICDTKSVVRGIVVRDRGERTELKISLTDAIGSPEFQGAVKHRGRATVRNCSSVQNSLLRLHRGSGIYAERRRRRATRRNGARNRSHSSPEGARCFQSISPATQVPTSGVVPVRLRFLDLQRSLRRDLYCLPDWELISSTRSGARFNRARRFRRLDRQIRPPVL
jgi:hypothetical protein